MSHGTTSITADMPFAAGSITKTWTAAAILQLPDEGVLGLEDTVTDDEPGRLWTPGEVITTFQLEPYFEPGLGWHNSNSGYALLRASRRIAVGSSPRHPGTRPPGRVRQDAVS